MNTAEREYLQGQHKAYPSIPVERLAWLIGLTNCEPDANLTKDVPGIASKVADGGVSGKHKPIHR